MLQLELLTNNPKNIDVQKPSFLFIHGMWHGAWCWEPYFLPYFEKHELKAYALSLSNHSNSAKRKPFNLLRISDYVKDIKQVIDGINEKLIIVGHSMGGFVLQKYLEKNDATGAVLMASVPPFGIWNGTLFVLKNFTGAFL
ncbi:MAG: alpha/beta hydrolase [Bacteroidales bacterium]|nr:alpha/beta hydrolase [Bacteroidales bacterium]